MSDARRAILAKMRSAMGRKADDIDRKAAVADRLQRSPRGPIPARGQVDGAERTALFRKMAEAVQASVVRVGSREGVPEAVAAYLKSKNLPATVRMGEDPRLSEMPWSAQKHMETLTGRAENADLATVSHALGGVAETGTLMLVSGPDNPTTLNFLPEHHIVVLEEADIAGDYESVWARIRERFGKGVMPRTVNMITGPSRSADIEQTLLLGAHGPRALHIVIVERT
ncbi:LutC/YkgG family protein [Stappia stellulata]|uniref:LutC/YkgG family protein n=1 Tax=Stappia stellulata TaxID=71235 RepID=UPI000407B96D|nr:lactate utilization protein [Stappia stellulata]